VVFAVEQTSSQPEAPVAQANAWVPYVVPMAVFVMFTSLVEPRAPVLYPWLYIVKVILVTVCVAACRSPLHEIRFEARVLLPAVLVGAAVFAVWIWLEPLTHYPHFAFLGKRVEYNPFDAIGDGPLRGLFLVARFYGLAVLVPLVEEIFWRSFMLRFISDPDDFQRLRQGQFSWIAFAVVAVAFGATHPEWMEAIICGLAYGLLLRYTRNLFACIVAHGVTNLMLGIYIVTHHAWKFW
jgi:CAAX prenyl protease-like protein